MAGFYHYTYTITHTQTIYINCLHTNRAFMKNILSVKINIVMIFFQTTEDALRLASAHQTSANKEASTHVQGRML